MTLEERFDQVNEMFKEDYDGREIQPDSVKKAIEFATLACSPTNVFAYENGSIGISYRVGKEYLSICFESGHEPVWAGSKDKITFSHGIGLPSVDDWLCLKQV